MCLCVYMHEEGQKKGSAHVSIKQNKGGSEVCVCVCVCLCMRWLFTNHLPHTQALNMKAKEETKCEKVKSDTWKIQVNREEAPTAKQHTPQQTSIFMFQPFFPFTSSSLQCRSFNSLFLSLLISLCLAPAILWLIITSLLTNISYCVCSRQNSKCSNLICRLNKALADILQRRFVCQTAASGKKNWNNKTLFWSCTVHWGHQ